MTFANSSGMRVEDIVLKIGNWVRFDQNGTDKMALTLNNVENTSVYQYFQVPAVSQVSYSVNTKQSTFKVEQDCQYDYVFNESCIGTFENHICTNGSRNGTKKHWINITVYPTDGGDACPRNPFELPCVNYECDRDCVWSTGEWSDCLDNKGNAVSCGSHGQQFLHHHISQETKYDGITCPVGNDLGSIIIAHDSLGSSILAKNDKIQYCVTK